MAVSFKDKSSLAVRIGRTIRSKFSALRRIIYNKDLYFSQYGQDKYILDYFDNKKEGFFIDIGAYNGVTFSNTLRMENLGWKGICIEPNPDMFKKVCRTRKCAKYNVALDTENTKKEFTKITGYCAVLSGIKEEYCEKHIERIKKELEEVGGTMDTVDVKTMTFDTLMADFKDVSVIDYISIDTEGNEFKILKTIDFKKYDIKTVSVENNYSDPKLQEFMENAGYYCATKLGCDEIYIKKGA